MTQTIISFFTFLITMLAIDSVWLGVMINRFYRNQIGHLLEESPKLAPGAVFYFLYVLGVTFFVLHPTLKNNSPLLTVLLTGSLFGCVTYGTYDLTNHATLKEWPLCVTIVDMIWGSFLVGTGSMVTVWLVRMISKG